MHCTLKLAQCMRHALCVQHALHAARTVCAARTACDMYSACCMHRMCSTYCMQYCIAEHPTCSTAWQRTLHECMLPCTVSSQCTTVLGEPVVATLSQSPHCSRGTAGDCRRLQENAGGCRRLQEASGDCRRMQEAAGGCTRLHEVAGECRSV